MNVASSGRSSPLPLIRCFHYLKIGVSHTVGVGLSHTEGGGLTQTDYEALTQGSWRLLQGVIGGTYTTFQLKT